VEIHRHGDRYVLLGAGPVTGNRLLAFSSKYKELVYAAFARSSAATRSKRATIHFRRNPFDISPEVQNYLSYASAPY
jgi:hypothetical protein